jgi:hypothetical protein
VNSTEIRPPPLPKRKRFPWIVYWAALGLIVLVALAPIGSVVACGWIANTHGCKVDEGSVHPCMINGKDYGHMLYTLGVMGWLMLVTLPAGALALGLWLVVLLLHRSRWRKAALSG